MKKLISVLLLFALLAFPASAFSFGDLGDALDEYLGTGSDEETEDIKADDLYRMEFRDSVDAYEKLYIHYVDAIIALANEDTDDAVDEFFGFLGDAIIWAEELEALDAFADSIDEDALTAEDWTYWLEAQERVLEYILDVGFEND